MPPHGTGRRGVADRGMARGGVAARGGGDGRGGSAGGSGSAVGFGPPAVSGPVAGPAAITLTSWAAEIFADMETSLVIVCSRSSRTQNCVRCAGAHQPCVQVGLPLFFFCRVLIA